MCLVRSKTSFMQHTLFSFLSYFRPAACCWFFKIFRISGFQNWVCKNGMERKETFLSFVLFCFFSGVFFQLDFPLKLN